MSAFGDAPRFEDEADRLRWEARRPLLRTEVTAARTSGFRVSECSVCHYPTLSSPDVPLPRTCGRWDCGVEAGEEWARRPRP